MQLIARFGAPGDLCGLTILTICERIVHLSNYEGIPAVGFIGLGRTIDISISLEASGELTTPPGDDGEWASDTAAPIESYFLGVPEPSCLMLGIAIFGWVGVLGRPRRCR